MKDENKISENWDFNNKEHHSSDSTIRYARRLSIADTFRRESKEIYPEETINLPDLPDIYVDKNVSARPVTEEKKLYIESYEYEEKTIISNLGHGGSGWTISIATIWKSIDLFAEKYKDNPPLNIAIVGAGCIGLMTAIELKNKYPNLEITVYYKQFEKQSSQAAAAIFSLSGLEDNRASEYACKTYKYFRNQKEFPIILKKTYYGIGCDQGMKCYVDNDIFKPKNLTLVSNGKNKIDSESVSYDEAICIDSNLVMQKLFSKVQEANITLVNREVKNFSELKELIIFDCAGVANIIGRKTKILPCLGHSLYFKIDNLKDYIYITNITLLKDGESDHKTHRFQWIPKNIYNDNGDIIANLKIGGSSEYRDFDQNEDKKCFELLDKIARYFTGQKTSIEGYKVIDKETIINSLDSKESSKKKPKNSGITRALSADHANSKSTYKRKLDPESLRNSTAFSTKEARRNAISGKDEVEKSLRR